MKKKVYDYLNDKDYDILGERLAYAMGAFDSSDFDDIAVKDVSMNPAVSKVYPFSNEYLDEMFKKIDLRGKRALVVGSSGDQALHAIDKGAEEVTILDANMWTKPFVELKLASMKNLSFEDFQQYICKGNIQDHRYYAKVSSELSEQSKAFWDSFLLNYSGYDAEIAKWAFFHNAVIGQEFQFGMRNHSYYMDKGAYERVREKLKKAKVNIEIAELQEFPQRAKGKYGLILLSNIYDYVKRKNFFQIFKKLNDKHLTDDGKIQAYIALDAEKKTRLENARWFEADINSFFERCHDNDINLEFNRLTFQGKGRAINWIRGNTSQENYMLPKGNLKVRKNDLIEAQSDEISTQNENV